MKHEIRYRAVCDKRLDLARTGHMLSPVTFLTRASAWRGMISAYDCPPCGASQTRNAAIKRLKRQGWRVEKVAVVDAAELSHTLEEYEACKEIFSIFEEENKIFQEAADYWADKAENENMALKDQLEHVRKSRDYSERDVVRLERLVRKTRVNYMLIGAALASIGIIGADLLLKAFG